MRGQTTHTGTKDLMELRASWGRRQVEQKWGQNRAGEASEGSLRTLVGNCIM